VAAGLGGGGFSIGDGAEVAVLLGAGEGGDVHAALQAKARSARMHPNSLQATRAWGTYFSTPVKTMPCIKMRWATKKTTTGTTSVIRAPVWIRFGRRP